MRKKIITSMQFSNLLSILSFVNNNNLIEIVLYFQANGDAALGKYAAGSVQGVGADKGLFVANHAY